MSLADEELEKISEYGLKIMELSRTSASFKMKFMSNAITFLQLCESNYNLAVDGQFIYYNPLYAIEKYKEDASYLDYAFLHMTVHCLFQHLFVQSQVDHRLWNAACDMYAFYIISSANNPKLLHNDQTRLAEEKAILSKASNAIKILTPEYIVTWLRDNPDVMDCITRHSLFLVDSHDLWYDDAAREGANCATKRKKHQQDDSEDDTEQDSESTNMDTESNDDTDDGDDEDTYNNGSSDNSETGDGSNSDSAGDGNGEGNGDEDSDSAGDGDEDNTNSEFDMSRRDLAEKWKNMAQRAQTSLSTGVTPGSEAGDALAGLQQVTRECISYEEFLHKFSVLTEQMTVNMDEFDYNFYTYGLQMYGNVPLIEPLEYKDEKRIHDFVIAIDTSGSTLSSLVQKFLSKTFNILSEQNSFDSHVCIHVIQCDTAVRSDVKLESLKDLEEYLRDFQIYGGGGTDFRPVFKYVDSLVDAKEFTDLRGLIYFTDGYGAFPCEPTQYETAFTFIGDDHCPLAEVPSWAITLELDKGEFKEDI